MGFGEANRPQGAIYPTEDKDADGKEFDGASKKYVVHIDKGQMPPVNGFWSFTMYDDKYFFVPNPLTRLPVKLAQIPLSGNATTQAGGLRLSRFRTMGFLTLITSGLPVREEH